MKTLYTYYRSSAAYRVRIALNLKGIEADYAFVHLRHKEHKSADYLRLNPQGLVPTFIDGETTISQSLAILEYLEEVYPDTPLLPSSAQARARVRQIALTVACDIHPLNNLQVLQYLTGPLNQDNQSRNAWYQHWVAAGFSALETKLAQEPDTGTFCHGNQPGLADICLVPQIYNARRFDVDMTDYPTLSRIDAACLELEAFAKAAPDAQADSE